MYEAKILADSISEAGHRLTTFQITFPRIVLAEFNTHRVLSRNSASSRAIPVLKRIESILESPFVPAAFGSNQAGMQAGATLEDSVESECRRIWLAARDAATEYARKLAEFGVHKQWANRLLEPFAWHTVIVTATEWENYWNLRVSKMAQPEIFTVSSMMRQLYVDNTPKLVRLDDPLPYHLPLVGEEYGDVMSYLSMAPSVAVKLSTARCARVSYLTHDGRRDPNKDMALYERLTSNGHMSPTEHPARPMALSELSMGDMCGNFRGWVQHRKEIPGEAIFVEPKAEVSHG